MVNYKLVAHVHKKKKTSSKVFGGVLIALGVALLLMGIIFSRGFMLPCFLVAAYYFYYDYNATKDFEYAYEDDKFTIDVIKGKRKKTTLHELNLNELEVVAPPTHEAVAKYRKDSGTEKLKKYDYTSYEENIPYYTMIIREDHEKIKILLDLTDEMLQMMKRKYPQKVYQ